MGRRANFSTGTRLLPVHLSAKDRQWLRAQELRPGERLEDIILRLLHHLSGGAVATFLTGQFQNPREMSIYWFLILADVPIHVRRRTMKLAFARSLMSLGALHDYFVSAPSRQPRVIRKCLYPILNQMGLSVSETDSEKITVAYKVRLPVHYADALAEIAEVMGVSPAAVISGLVQSALDAHAGQPHAEPPSRPASP